MDRNFIFALALSMLVLSLYQSVFVMPKRAAALKSSQTITAEQHTINSASQLSVEAEKIDLTTKIDFKEEIYNIKTKNIGFELSNVGGSLHKIATRGDEKTLPVENLLTIKGFEQAPFVLAQRDDKSAVYTFSNPDWKIVKQYSLIDENGLKVKISLTKTKESRLENLEFKAMFINGKVIDHQKDKSLMLYELSILQNGKVERKGDAYKFNPKDNKVILEKIDWIGYRGHYHAIVVKPEFDMKGYEYEVVSEKELNVNIKTKEQKIEVGQTVSYDFTIAVGNQDIGWLKTYKKDFEKIVAFSRFWILDVFSKGVYYTIPILYNICRSWGFSIILVSLLIYGITYPLTMKSMTSMRKMQLLQPKIAALQKRYKDDPKALNAEMVGIYKKEGVNPLGGCLPFILQMPVFMALYQVLWRSYYFQGKSFLWIKDLAQPDRLFILPFNLPFLGNEFNILPLVMGAVMFMQQKISSKSMIITDDTQAMQQKMMKYFFPIFIAFIFYHFASGLSLYFTVFYALSAWTQWKMAKIK